MTVNVAATGSLYPVLPANSTLAPLTVGSEAFFVLDVPALSEELVLDTCGTAGGEASTALLLLSQCPRGDAGLDDITVAYADAGCGDGKGLSRLTLRAPKQGRYYVLLDSE